MVGLTFTNSIFNKYTIGSGVGSINSSNRAVLKRRAYNSHCKDIPAIETDVRYIKVFFRGRDDVIQISQLAVYVNNVNIATTGIPTAANAQIDDESKNAMIREPINGILSNRDYPNIYHSLTPSGFGYWLLDLGQAYAIDSIVYYNRNNNNVRANGMIIETYDKNYNNNSPNSSVALNQFILNSDLVQTFNLQEDTPPE
jgi:hypothetical protein